MGSDTISMSESAAPLLSVKLIYLVVGIFAAPVSTCLFVSSTRLVQPLRREPCADL